MSGEEVPLVCSTPKGISLNVAGGQSKASVSESQGLAWYAITFMVINAIIGAGLLEFSYAFNAAGGLAAALSVQAILVVCIIATVVILAYCSEYSGSTTYPAILFALYGKKTETACSIAISLSAFGTSVILLILIGDQLGQFFVFVYGSDYCQKWYMSRKFTIAISSLAIILPLCFPKKLDFLKYASFLGAIAVMYVVGLITAKYFIGLEDVGTIKTKPDHFTDILTIFPSVLMNYQCHVSFLPIYSRLKDKSRKNFAKVISISYLICFGAYTAAASFGFLSFGDKIDPDILKSYAVTTDVIIAVFMTAAKAYLTYPIFCFCGRTEILNLWAYARRLSEADVEKYEVVRRITVTSLWFVTSLLLALFTPNIAVVINICGGVSSVFILIFPGMCLLKIALNCVQDSVLKRRFLVCLAVFFIVFGAFTFGFVTTQAIIENFNHSDEGHATSVCS